MHMAKRDNRLTIEVGDILNLKWLSEFIICNSITDILVCEPNIRRIDYLHISQTGMYVVHFSENHFEFGIYPFGYFRSIRVSTNKQCLVEYLKIITNQLVITIS